MLPDLLTRNLKLVICGTAAGRNSARQGLYYSDPRNRFWRTLAEVGLTPQQLTPADQSRLLESGIGLTDLVKEDSGPDSVVQPGRAEAMMLHMKLTLYRPRYLCFNGVRAARVFLRTSDVEYGVQRQRFGQTVLFVAPSTSGAAAASWSIEPWQNLADRVRRSKGSLTHR